MGRRRRLRLDARDSRKTPRWLALAMLLAVTASESLAHLGHGSDAEPTVSAPTMIAPGYSDLRFQAPEPGSYRLPPIRDAADGAVLDVDGSEQTLHELFDGRFVLLSFIYTNCDDINGCPLATLVLHRVRRILEDDPGLWDQVRMVSLSFDPEVDTPEVMARYGENLRSEVVDWRFLTTESNAALQPLLDDYGQGVTREYDSRGAYLGHISHVLRVYLIDREKRVRNIYNVSFLHPDLIMADLETLRIEEKQGGWRPSADMGDGMPEEALADTLVETLRRPPLGLPAPPLTDAGVPTPRQVELGRRLFFDRRMSANGTLSCANCHIPEQGFTQNHMARSIGIGGQSLRRNSMSLFNVAYPSRLFADGREHALESLAWQELLDERRMGNLSVAGVVDEIRQAPDYAGLFEAAFDGRPAHMESIAGALAGFMRTLVSANSPFDRWHFGGDSKALDASAQRGFALFTGKAGCAACHTLGEDHALFTDDALHNTGIGWFQSMAGTSRVKSLEIAPGVRIDIDHGALTGIGDGSFNDLGFYEVTQNPDDRWKFRTPGLRNVALTAPYMHDGSLADLESVVAYYDQGGHRHAQIDQRIRPLGLDHGERRDLVEFLKSLTGDNVEAIMKQAAPRAAAMRDSSELPAHLSIRP